MQVTLYFLHFVDTKQLKITPFGGEQSWQSTLLVRTSWFMSGLVFSCSARELNRLGSKPNNIKALKVLDTSGNCQRPVFSLGDLKICRRNCKRLNSIGWSPKLRENNGRTKTPLSYKLCAFRFLVLIPQLMSRNQFKYFSWEISFLKKKLLQRDPFL